jgi:2,3-bisphosphoglycerate-dependent phosphoglycerate mutase
VSHLALVRHGQSVWNRDQRFTGWTDVGLSSKGIDESRRAGRLLADAGLRFDVCFTSVLARGVQAALHVLEGADQTSTPLLRSWCLNERHFGALQGVHRWDALRLYGPLRVIRLQRGYDVPPPPLDPDDPRCPGYDPLYAELHEKELPLAESLADTFARVVPYWQQTIAPELMKGRNVLVVAHKNSLRTLMKHLEQIPDRDTPALRIATGEPIVYELDGNLRILQRDPPLSEPRRRFWRWTGISPA